MPTTIDSTSTSCYKKARNRVDSNSEEGTKIFKTKVDLLNCRPEDVKLKMEGNRIIIEGILYNNKYKEKPTAFTKHYIMPENCDLKKMRYTITSDGVYITAPRREIEGSTDFPRLEDNCTNNCVDLNDRFEIRLNVQEFQPNDIKIKVNGNTITIKAKRLEEFGMKRVIKTYSLPDSCEITKLERRFTPQGHLILSIPKFLGLFCDTKKRNNKDSEENTRDNPKCKFNITTEKFEIKIDVSNYRPEDINIIQQKHLVTIEGKSRKKMCKSEEKFEKTFVLPPDYDVSKIDRKFHSDGVLVVSVPRAEGKIIEDFKTFLPENTICDMKIKDEYVEIKLDIVGFEPEEITIKLTGKNTITIEGKQPNQKKRIAKSFMKSYLLPSDCDTKKINKHITSNGILIVRVPRYKRTCSLDNLSEILDDKMSFSNRTKSGSLDDLSVSNEKAMVDSAELDTEKFEMKFNVQGFNTEDIYVKINKNVVTVECKHPNPVKSIVKSYFIPKVYDLNSLHTFITHDDILIVTIPRFKSQIHNHVHKKKDNYSKADQSDNGFTTQKEDDNYIINVDIRGYNNNDISLDVKGQTIIVQGDHLGNQTISRSFSKKFIVPPNYNVDALTYYISAEGILKIEIPKKFLRQNGRDQNHYTFPEKKHISTPRSTNSIPNMNRHSDVPSSFKKSQLNTRHKENFNSTPNIRQNMLSHEGRKYEFGINSEKNEIYQLFVDVKDCYEENINVRINGNNVTVEGKKIGDYRSPSSDLIKHFTIPDEFDVTGLKTSLENGILIVEVPKYNISTNETKEASYKGRDLLSNVKIGQQYIVVEMDASGLTIEDFEIVTFKNVLTIEVLKDNIDRFKTKVDLPEDAIIDDISKQITPDGKLLVQVPRKVNLKYDDATVDSSIRRKSYEEETLKLIQNEKRKSCLVLSKNTAEKFKSVKFLVNDFEQETNDDVKFASLPRSSRCKSYNSVFLDEQLDEKFNNLSRDQFELKIFVPHHEPDEVIVKIRGSTITIEGKKKNDERNFYFSKNFFKTYLVPKNIDKSQLKTTFTDNYLIITAPRNNEVLDSA